MTATAEFGYVMLGLACWLAGFMGGVWLFHRHWMRRNHADHDGDRQ
jgi:hypothetical protein